jgi:hypothetical protein
MIKANGWALALVATAALAACGGGGSDTPATPSAVTIAGTAAKGAALAGATVSVKCAAGAGTATTGSDGKYTVTITGANLPCALKVVGTEGSVFHSVVAGTGSTGSFAANITPLTELLLAKLAGATPSSFFGGFGGSSSVSAAAVTDAIAYVKSALAGAADLTGVNPATDALVVGDVHDQKIDAAMARLASIGVTLDQAIAAIVANPAAPDVVAAPLRLSASDCAWLKSGKYRMINPYETDPKWKAHVLSIDAAAKTALDQDNVTTAFTSDGGCQYTVDDVDSTTKVMVSSGGVLVAFSQSKTNAAIRSVTIGLPEQTLPLSEFAGTWNLAGWDPASGIATPGFVAQTDEATIDANGNITAVSHCLGLAACAVGGAPFGVIAANAASGGFDIKEGGVATGRAFPFKTLSGKAVFVVISNDGQFTVGTRKETLGTLPAVGAVSNFREFTLNGNGTVSNLIANTVTVTATDAVAKTVTRIRAADSRVDSLGYDKPRDGLRYRAPNSCTINSVASNCAETVQLPLQGMGITLSLSVGTNPTTASYNVSVGKPN